MEFIINIEWVLCVLVVIGGVVMIFAGGDKKAPKRPKITHCMEKRGTDHSFFKNRKGKNYANLRLPRLQAVGLLFFLLYLSYLCSDGCPITGYLVYIW